MKIKDIGSIQMPIAISLHVNIILFTLNADPTSDSLGCKQAFTAKAWLCDVIELNLGLPVTSDGIYRLGSNDRG